MHTAICTNTIHIGGSKSTVLDNPTLLASGPGGSNDVLLLADGVSGLLLADGFSFLILSP